MVAGTGKRIGEGVGGREKFSDPFSREDSSSAPASAALSLADGEDDVAGEERISLPTCCSACRLSLDDMRVPEKMLQKFNVEKMLQKFNVGRGGASTIEMQQLRQRLDDACSVKRVVRHGAADE